MFKVGDKVKVRRFKEVDVEVMEKYFLLSMFKYEEAVTVVTGFDTDGDILLAIDEEKDYWHPDMLVKVEPIFKVGDKIRIREDLKVGRIYEGVDFVRPMLEFLGKEATITEIDGDGDYLLDIDNGDFFWSTEMLVKVGDTFKIGDKVKIREDLIDFREYGGMDFVRPMLEFLGKEATITDKAIDGAYSLDIDDDFCWSAEMFEPKTYSEDVVEENMVIHKSITLEDTTKPVVHENEVSRLSKAVIEYENIVHELETEVDYYETKYIDLVEKYNVLVEKHNSLLEELKEDYIQ